MLLSIIIPVYNVEDYINDCINSILHQSFKDYEIVLVDDGSEDKSGRICDQYADQYSHISVVHKINGGLSDARNAGLKIAKGKYILFVDADDYISEESLANIMMCLKALGSDIDVVFLEAIKIYPDGKKIPMGDGYIENKINNQPKDIVMKHLSTLNKFPGSACTKLVMKNLIINNQLYFERGLLSEDIDWTIKLLKTAKTFGYTSYPYYYYRQKRNGSITDTADRKNAECILSIIEKWSSQTIDYDYQRDINAFMAYEYIVLLYNYSKLTGLEKKELYSRLKSLKWIMRYARSRKEKLVSVFINIAGINITSQLLNVFRRGVSS